MKRTHDAVLTSRTAGVATSSLSQQQLEEQQQQRVPDQIPTMQRQTSYSIEHVQFDVLEYYCYWCCCAMVDQVRQEQSNLTQCLAAISPFKFRRYGRLWSRLQIACLSLTLASLPTQGPSAREACTSFETHISSQRWKEIMEQLGTVRNFLLRRDADLPVPFLIAGQTSAPNGGMLPNPNSECDSKRSQHLLFRAEYRQALQFLQVQQISFAFREALRLFWENCDDSNHTDYNGLEHNDTSAVMEKQRLLPLAINEYRAALDSLFSSEVPPALVSFLDDQIYTGDEYDRSNSAKGSVTMAKRLYNQSLAVAYGQHPAETAAFSISAVQQKTRELLWKWSENILSVPTLIKLGYCGVDVASTLAKQDAAVIQEIQLSRTLPSSSLHSGVNEERVPPDDLASPANHDGSWGHKDDDDEINNEGDMAISIGLEPRKPEKRLHHQPISTATQTTWQNKRQRTSPPTNNRHNVAITAEQEEKLWHGSHQEDMDKSPSHRKVEWTLEESEAIREGYARFGPRWRMIKDNCDGRLCRRTNVQIKDKFRTMVHQGKIQVRQEEDF